MVDITGPIDQDQSATTPIDPESNNPIEVTQTSTLQLVEPNGGVDDDGFELSVNLTGANVAEQVNIAIAIDTSGSTSNDSGTDFDGDGNTETILEAELFAARELFDAYVAAGYDPSEISISLVTYSSGAQVQGTFTLDQSTEFNAALQSINNQGSSGTTNYEAGLAAIGDAWNGSGASPSDTNLAVFMSDGFPFPGGQDIAGASQALEDDWSATIKGIGLGERSSLAALNILDNTAGGATQVLSGQELLDVVVEPLTEADFLRFEIVIEGVDANGDPLTQTITLDENDPHIIQTPLGWSVDCLEIDPIFPAPQDIEITVNGIFGEDPGNPGSGEQVVTTMHQVPLVICFTPGTMILTPDGPQAVETLEAGDRVVTRDHGVQPIRWIGATTISASYVAVTPSLRPILIRQGALGPDLPERDMRVSRQHRVLVRDWRAEVMFGVDGGILVPAFSLCNGDTVTEERPSDNVTYIHMAFDDHEVVYADGVEVESFHPAERTVAALSAEQRDELFALFPDLQLGDGFAFDSARRQASGREARVLKSGANA